MAKHNLKILRCSHRKILKVCLVICQRYEIKVQELSVEFTEFIFVISPFLQIPRQYVSKNSLKNLNVFPSKFSNSKVGRQILLLLELAFS